jgi:hypothetical protein
LKDQLRIMEEDTFARLEKLLKGKVALAAVQGQEAGDEDHQGPG